MCLVWDEYLPCSRLPSVRIERPARQERNCTSQTRTGRYLLHLRIRDIRQSGIRCRRDRNEFSPLHRWLAPVC